MHERKIQDSVKFKVVLDLAGRYYISCKSKECKIQTGDTAT